MQPESDTEKVNPFMWVLAIISGVSDTAKMFLFTFNGIPGPGTAIDAGGSFIISVAQITGVFGGLWYQGLYKGENSTKNALITLGISGFDLIPVVDDIPLTTPTVIYMIVKAYARKSKLAGLVGTVALGAATGGVGLAAEGAVAAAGAGAAERTAGTAALKRLAPDKAIDMSRSSALKQIQPMLPEKEKRSEKQGADANDTQPEEYRQTA